MHPSLIQAALQSGAARAAFLSGSQVVFCESFREICHKNQCGSYGRCWMCPPEIGEIRDLIARARGYSHALMYQTLGMLEDSFDVEGMFHAAAHHAQVSQTLQEKALDLLPSSFLHLSCGGCHLCPVCAKRTAEPCRHPEKALPSLEGYGIDVYQTAAAAGLPYSNGCNTVTYFGMILFSE